MSWLLHIALLASFLNGPAEPPTRFTDEAYQPKQFSEVKEVAKVAEVSPPSTSVKAGASGCSLEYIGQKESGNNYLAQNSSSTASGKYQYLDSTWNGYSGYKRAKDAPPEVQEERARADFAKRGGSMWQVCGFKK